MRWQAVYNGEVYVYRGDEFVVAGQRGGKARTAWHLVKQCLEESRPGVVTAGARHSPQIEIVSGIAYEAAVKCVCFYPASREPLTGPLKFAKNNGAELIAIRPGYNSVIAARAHDYAIKNDWTEIPFGMECQTAVDETRKALVEVGLPPGTKRLVVAVGSSMSLAGLLWGLVDLDRTELPVLGIQVGAQPYKRLARWGPTWMQVDIVPSDLKYDQAAPASWQTEFKSPTYGFTLDPIYEAKCVPYLEPGDAFWIVGRRRGE